MSVLVTGGLGYIGSHTCVELMNAGFDVVVVDNLYNCKKSSYYRIKALVGKDFPFYECDIRDKEGMSAIFEKESATIEVKSEEAKGTQFEIRFYNTIV